MISPRRKAENPAARAAIRVILPIATRAPAVRRATAAGTGRPKASTRQTANKRAGPCFAKLSSQEIMSLVYGSGERMDSVNVPIGVRRPTVAVQALGGEPLLDAGGADAARVKGMPGVTAGTGPEFARRRAPIAERATNPGTSEAGSGVGSFGCNDFPHAYLDSAAGTGVS